MFLKSFSFILLESCLNMDAFKDCSQHLNSIHGCTTLANALLSDTFARLQKSTIAHSQYLVALYVPFEALSEI